MGTPAYKDAMYECIHEPSKSRIAFNKLDLGNKFWINETFLYHKNNNYRRTPMLIMRNREVPNNWLSGETGAHIKGKYSEV